MFIEAQNPVLLPDDDILAETWDFQSVVPNGNLCVYDDRWAWITDPSAGIWMNWLADPNQVSDVEIPLTIRAADYSTFPLQ